MKDVFVNLRRLYDIIERCNKGGEKPSAIKCGIQEEKKTKLEKTYPRCWQFFQI